MHTKVNKINAKQVEHVLRRQLLNWTPKICMVAKPQKRYWFKRVVQWLRITWLAERSVPVQMAQAMYEPRLWWVTSLIVRYSSHGGRGGCCGRCARRDFCRMGIKGSGVVLKAVSGADVSRVASLWRFTRWKWRCRPRAEKWTLSWKVEQAGALVQKNLVSQFLSNPSLPSSRL